MTDIDWLIERHELLSVRLNREFGDSAKFHKKTAEALAALRDERDRYKKSSEYYCEQYNRVADADNAAQARAEQAEADNAALREALNECVTTMQHARVFVTSRERIKGPEGERLYDEALESARAAVQAHKVTHTSSSEDTPSQ